MPIYGSFQQLWAYVGGCVQVDTSGLVLVDDRVATAGSTEHLQGNSRLPVIHVSTTRSVLCI